MSQNSDLVPLDWLHDTVNSHGPLPVILLWRIWCARNACIFEGKQFKPYDIVAQSYALMSDVFSAFGIPPSRLRVSSGIEVSWKAPPNEWVALNVDGSAFQNPVAAGFGGLIRDSNGLFLRGYYGFLGSSTVMHAELSAIRYGLSMCWELGYKKIICYSDSLNTLKLIDEADVVYHKHGNEIASIRHLLSHQWEVKIQHVFREANFCADFLAKLGTTCMLPQVSLNSPPMALLQLLQADALGCSFVRP